MPTKYRVSPRLCHAKIIFEVGKQSATFMRQNFEMNGNHWIFMPKIYSPDACRYVCTMVNQCRQTTYFSAQIAFPILYSFIKFVKKNFYVVRAGALNMYSLYNNAGKHKEKHGLISTEACKFAWSISGTIQNFVNLGSDMKCIKLYEMLRTFACRRQ